MFSRPDTGLGRLRPDTAAAAAIVFAFVAAGLIAGYVIASGKTVPILLTLAAFAGIALLNALPLVVWIILVGVLLVSGPVMMYVPALEKIGWAFSVLGFLLTGVAMLYPAIGRYRFVGRLPTFTLLAVLLFAYGMLSGAYSEDTIGDLVRAGKRYFQFFGLIFILSVAAFPARLVQKWWAFLLALALVQFPFALYQRVALVPLLEGMDGNVYSLDVIVGTMEGSLRGGGSSSIMVLLLIFALASLLALHREGVLPFRWLVVLAVIASAPLPLGEVTLIVALLPLALAAVYIDLVRRRPLRFVGIGIAIAVVMAVLGWIFLAINPVPGQSVGDRILAMIAYNFGDVGYYGRGLNRTTVYTYWFEQLRLADPVSFFFGHGLGSSFGGLGERDPGYIDKAHSGMFVGLTTASSLLWDLGIIGFTLFMWMLVSAVRHALKLTEFARPGSDRALCRALLAMALMIAVMPFYSDAMISVPSLQVLMALCIGLIAWRWRSEGRTNVPA